MGKCQICGKITKFNFPLCKDCNDLKEQGQIVQCDDCGKWNAKDVVCECKKKEERKPESELTCIICGKPSNGQHFCFNCWKQFNNKVVYIQVKKCKEFTKLDAEYESELTCDDGHLVKSPYEKIIDNWLYSEGIKHAYEKKIDVDETHELTPDFFIPEYNGIKNIYVEFWGYGEDNIKYQRIKEYKLKIYPELVKRENIAVVYLNKKEVDTDKYKTKIKYAKQGEIKE